MLGAILRLAESLDRSRTGAIRGLAVNTRADTVEIELEGRGDAELEVWAANRSLIPLERTLKRPVRLQVRIIEDPDATPAARAEQAPTPIDAPVRRRAKRAPARRKRRARKAPAAPSRDQAAPAALVSSAASQPESNPESDVDEGDASDELTK